MWLSSLAATFECRRLCRAGRYRLSAYDARKPRSLGHAVAAKLKRCSVVARPQTTAKGTGAFAVVLPEVNERIGCHMGVDELIDYLFAEGDELVFT